MINICSNGHRGGVDSTFEMFYRSKWRFFWQGLDCNFAAWAGQYFVELVLLLNRRCILETSFCSWQWRLGEWQQRQWISLRTEKWCFQMQHKTRAAMHLKRKPSYLGHTLNFDALQHVTRQRHAVLYCDVTFRSSCTHFHQPVTCYADVRVRYLKETKVSVCPNE